MARLTLEWSPVRLHTESNVRVNAPLSAGVYWLSYKSDDKVRVFYVGQADNLDKRLRDHLSASEPDLCIRGYVQNRTCYYRFARVARQADRNGAERALYDHFSPACNDVAPPGPAADINFE